MEHEPLFDANWKVYMDDEGDHAPLLHKTFQLLRWRGGSGSQVRTRFGHRIIETVMDGHQGNLELLKDPSLLRYRGGAAPRNKHPHRDAGSLLVTSWPLGARRTEVHYAYFVHQDDDPELRRHRLRQSSNLIGPSGFISLEDGAVFGRIQKAMRAGAAHTHYLRGWRDDRHGDPCRVCHNDEIANTVWWEMYRRTNGFERAGSRP